MADKEDVNFPIRERRAAELLVLAELLLVLSVVLLIAFLLSLWFGRF